MLALKQEQLFDAIDVLPIDVKTQLIDKLLTSITPIDTSIDALWIKEVKKRKNEIESDLVTLIDGDEVFQKIAKRLNP
ncbi:hypothetical protein MNB_SM-7-135 [hydrothermal vent metagenome]|uniref:Addiction module protein n=1 Tax=hydrothermal vent metagenome TaxID=652676 RepID=A0A1W1BC24_9ZZZZ